MTLILVIVAWRKAASSLSPDVQGQQTLEVAVTVNLQIVANIVVQLS